MKVAENDTLTGVGKSCLLLQFTDKRFQPVHDLTVDRGLISTPQPVKDDFVTIIIHGHVSGCLDRSAATTTDSTNKAARTYEVDSRAKASLRNTSAFSKSRF